MSAGPPTANPTIRGHKRPRHTPTSEDSISISISSGPHNDTDVQDLPHIAPPPPPPPPQLRPSAQRKAAYLASQSPHRKQIIAKHLRDSTAFAEGAREREGRSGGYFDMMCAANREFGELSRLEKAKMKKCRRMFKKAEVTVAMWKALAQKVFGYWGGGLID